MLAWDPKDRASAERMLSHPWLNMHPLYDNKMSD